MTDLKQTLPRIGPKYTSIAEKQLEVVKLIKNFEIEAKMNTTINQNIPGLRKKNKPFGGKFAITQFSDLFVLYSDSSFTQMVQSIPLLREKRSFELGSQRKLDENSVPNSSSVLVLLHDSASATRKRLH